MPFKKPRTSRDREPTPTIDFEAEYWTAVQSFIKRDHITTHSTLSSLLSTLETELSNTTRRPWHQFDTRWNGKGVDWADWLVKVLKLYISAHASLFAYHTDPNSLPLKLRQFVPPNSPKSILKHVHDTCVDMYKPDILPPAIISTLLLSSLQYQPSEPALDAAHHIAEDWLVSLPDSLMEILSSSVRAAHQQNRISAIREEYSKVIQLFVVEILAREGEWEMARGILDGDGVMSSRRKEELYGQLRSLQTTRSFVSPSSSDQLPSPEPQAKSRDRSGSASSSSTERTARPGIPLAVSSINGHDLKGKSKAGSTTSESGLLRHIEVNPGPPVPTTTYTRLLDYLPAVIRDRLSNLNATPFYYALPLPLVILIALSLRRRLRRRAHGAVVVATGLDEVRARLARARGRGVVEWFLWWLRWWMARFTGVWRLGTTITFV